MMYWLWRREWYCECWDALLFFYSMSMSPKCELEFGSRFGCHFLFDELTSEDSSYNMLLLLSTTAWTLAYQSWCCILHKCCILHWCCMPLFLRGQAFRVLEDCHLWAPWSHGVRHCFAYCHRSIHGDQSKRCSSCDSCGIHPTSTVGHLRRQRAKRWRVIKSWANLDFITSSYHSERNNQVIR